jgi:predicted metal-binding membrane protein
VTPVQPVVDTPFALERLIRRDRVVIVLGLAGITLLAWIYLVRMASGMHAAAMDAEMHAAMGMPGMRTWGATDLLMLFLMWDVMMIGMMLPSAAPLMLLVVGTYRRQGPGARGMTTAFVSGYLAAWTVFSAAAALMQAALHQAALLSPGMASRSPVLVGGIFLIAGTYQWLPLKNACLTRCRSPLDFLGREWREGLAGARSMGLRHGLFCVGCCWALMTLLFVAGVMNLVWVAAIAAFVLVEKLMRHGAAAGRAAGIVFFAWGVYVLVSAA